MAARKTRGVSKKYSKAGDQGAEIVGKILAWSVVGLIKGTMSLFRAMAGKGNKKQNQKRYWEPIYRVGNSVYNGVHKGEVAL